MFAVVATLLLSTACSFGEDQNVSHPTLADWHDRLTLVGILDRARDGSLQATVLISPLSNFECPHFAIQATINGLAVDVERKYVFRANCHMPSMHAVLDPALLQSQRTSFPGPGFDQDVITRFDVELSDRSGHYAYKFGRDLPPWIEGRIVRTNSGALQAGERVEVVLEPPPRSTTSAYFHSQGRYWWLYPANELPLFPLRFMPVAGFEQTAAGYAFQWPEVDGGLTEISVDMEPYSESLACPFAECQLQNEVTASSFPVSVTIQVPQE